MNLNIEILEITNDENDYEQQKVKFSCYDDEDTAMVSFIDSINVAHACFLVMQGIDNSNAYGQMLYAIENEGLEGLTVGRVFRSVEDEGKYETLY